MPGMFARPRRSVLSTLGMSGGATRIVSTEDELQQAVTATQEKLEISASYSLALSPIRIVIAKPITLTKPVKIPQPVYGLTIEAATRGAVLSASGTFDAMFIVYGTKVTIRDIYATPGTATVESFIRLDPAAAADGLAVDLNVTGCDTAGGFTYFLYRPAAAAGGLSDALVAENNLAGNIDLDNATECRFIGNVLNGNDIVLRGGSNNVICLNTLGGGDVTTSATSGGNVIAFNTNAGTITEDANDIIKTADGPTAGDYNS